MCRDAIIDMMWPDVEPAKARSRLSSTLLRMRRTINAPRQPDVVLTSDHRIGLACDGRVSADLWEIDKLCACIRRKQVGDWQPAEISRLLSAVDARRGPFLDGVEGEWTETARRHCAETWATMLGLLLRHYRYSSQPGGAIRIAKLMLRQDPYREDLHGLLVRLYAETGQHGKAHEQFSTCASMLETELGVTPGPEICAALAKAQAVTETPSPRAMAQPALDRLAADPIEAAIASLEATLETAQKQLDALKSRVGKLH